MEISSAERTIKLIGLDAFKKLEQSHVLVIGLGGVGSYTAEALARAGIGEISLVDYDVISRSNINRQLVALESTVGKYKVDVMRDRILDINPGALVHVYRIKYCADTADCLDMKSYNFAVDAIDIVSSKVELIVRAVQSSTPIISSMGAGNKLDPSQFCVADLCDTNNCPLARAVRKKLRKHGITSLPVVFSNNPVSDRPASSGRACGTLCDEDTDIPDNELSVRSRYIPPGSISFVPSVAGLIIAGEVVRRLIEKTI